MVKKKKNKGTPAKDPKKRTPLQLEDTSPKTSRWRARSGTEVLVTQIPADTEDEARAVAERSIVAVSGGKVPDDLVLEKQGG